MPTDHDTAVEATQMFEPIAPAWHTVAVLALLATVASLSLLAHSDNSAAIAQHRILSYLPTIALEWFIVAFIWFGCRRRGGSLRTLLGPMSWNWRSVLRDAGLALLFLLLSNVVLSVFPFLLHIKRNAMVKNMLPRTDAEVLVFSLLSLTAGICEEIIFRGYFQKQWTAWFRSVPIAIGLQGILFGSLHAYQGPKMIFPLAVYGCLFGYLAHWRRNLRPNIAAHFLQDGLVGLVARFLVK